MDERGNTDYSRLPWQRGTGGLSADGTTPYLILIEGGPPGAMLPLAPAGCSIGRALENSVQLVENSVSRKHAWFEVDDRGLPTLTDLNSTNGTFLNGAPMPSQQPLALKSGDRIQFGSTLVVKYAALDPYEERFQRDMFERTVRDGLTGLYRRDHFLDLLNQLIERNVRRDLGTAILMIDLDHFKRINDTFLHQAGDVVLREVAALLRAEARRDDLMGRYGGEEFVAALTVTHPMAGWERAEGIRTRLESHPFSITEADGLPLRVTCSIGLSYCPPDEPRSAATLIGDADLCLLQAKARGRNRVVVSTSARIDAGAAIPAPAPPPDPYDAEVTSEYSLPSMTIRAQSNTTDKIRELGPIDPARPKPPTPAPPFPDYPKSDDSLPGGSSSSSSHPVIPEPGNPPP